MSQLLSGAIAKKKATRRHEDERSVRLLGGIFVKAVSPQTEENEVGIKAFFRSKTEKKSSWNNESKIETNILSKNEMEGNTKET